VIAAGGSNEGPPRPHADAWRAAGWRPLDLHAHSTHSDGVLSVAELVALAERLEVRPSVSDHISRDVAGAVSDLDELRAYLDDLEQHSVARGGEFCWHDSLWREIPDELAARFTHWIGSLHAVFLPGGESVHAFRPLPTGLAVADYMRAHLENAERFAAEMPVDVLAHPTLLPMAFRKMPPEELWTEEHEARLVRALADAGIAFEISNRYRPHDSIVKRAVDAGVRISLGSDGHSKEQVARVAGPLALARHFGVRDADLYDPAVHGSRAPGRVRV
jgi:histidinol phosphatase-like PHP family hydrolase